MTAPRDGGAFLLEHPVPDAPSQWRSRIAGYGNVDPEQLLASPDNWRIHPRHQQAALAGVLDQIGYVQAVIVNRTTNHVLDGHMRVAMALSHGEDSIPVVYVELSPEEERLALATFDPIGAMAGQDREQLGALLTDLQAGVDLDGLLASLADASGLIDESSPTFDASFRPSTSPNIAVPSYTDDDVVRAAGKLEGQFSDNRALRDVTCPKCGEVFYVGGTVG